MDFVCQCVGGSYMYGLNGPDSDEDLRGVYLHNDIKYIIGLDHNSNKHNTHQNNDQDSDYKEFRHSLQLLRQSNSQIIELLFNDEWEIITPLWETIQKNKLKLIDSTRLFKCLTGYAFGELKLMNGQRTGKLGSKRQMAIQKYSYSPKNCCQLLRLCWAGCYFFEHSIFPVKIEDFDKEFFNYLKDIKFNPQNHNVKDLNIQSDLYIKQLKKYYDNRKENFEFDEDLANNLCLQAYRYKLGTTNLYFL